MGLFSKFSRDKGELKEPHLDQPQPAEEVVSVQDEAPDSPNPAASGISLSDDVMQFTSEAMLKEVIGDNFREETVVQDETTVAAVAAAEDTAETDTVSEMLSENAADDLAAAGFAPLEELPESVAPTENNMENDAEYAVADVEPAEEVNLPDEPLSPLSEETMAEIQELEVKPASRPSFAAEPTENFIPAPEPETVTDSAFELETTPVSVPEPEAVDEPKTVVAVTPSRNIISTPDGLKWMDTIDDQEVECVVLEDINKVNFSDVYITPDQRCYIWGGKTNAGLVHVEFADFAEFFAAITKTYSGTPSYLLQYKGRNYRVERSVATCGAQYCARKMPIKVPNLRDLGLPRGVYDHLLSLAGESGLILLAGATGSGKSTTIAALLKEYLRLKGGYAFTIEDPVELPLDGVYITSDNELGLCKQTTPPGGSWAEGIKSALRSKPRYIYLGEIRSPDIASEALRAATSGHLVLSSIHANNVNEAINSLVKYAASSGISESMAYELVASGFLGCVHQILSGAPKRAHVTTLFATPDSNTGCQVRGMIRNGKMNMATLIEQQKVLLSSHKPLFK